MYRDHGDFGKEFIQSSVSRGGWYSYFGIFDVPIFPAFGPQSPRPTATRFLGVVGDFPRIDVFFANRYDTGLAFGGASSPANFDRTCVARYFDRTCVATCVARRGRWVKAFYKVTITVTDEGSTYTVQGW